MNKNYKYTTRLYKIICTIVLFTITVFSSSSRPPTTPYRPEVIDIEATGCTVKQHGLYSDADNSETTRYYIEQREKWDLNWKFKGASPKLPYVIQNLPEGSVVQYRLTADNNEGTSLPSLPTVFYTCSSPYSL